MKNKNKLMFNFGQEITSVCSGTTCPKQVAQYHRNIHHQFAAIGFLLAAKSIFRFGDLRESSDCKRTEYILFGTFLSFTLAVLLGVGVGMLLHLT